MAIEDLAEGNHKSLFKVPKNDNENCNMFNMFINVYIGGRKYPIQTPVECAKPLHGYVVQTHPISPKSNLKGAVRDERWIPSP